VAAVNEIITSYKPEISKSPVPVHLMTPSASANTPTPSPSSEVASQADSKPTEATSEPSAEGSAIAPAPTESKSSEQAAVSVPSAKNIWNWATTVFHDFLQENLEDYELSRWGVFFFERTKVSVSIQGAVSFSTLNFLKARIPSKLSIEHQRQFLRPLIGRIDHDFYSRGQGREQTYHLYWALYDILLCRMYGEKEVKPEGEAVEEGMFTFSSCSNFSLFPSTIENVNEIECKKIMTEIGKIPHLGTSKTLENYESC